MDKLMGVYKIENIKNHKLYIGSSKDIYKRWDEHLYALKSNKHHSCKLQSSYNRTKDKSIFKFSIIEIISDIKCLREKEQYYIDFYDTYNTGYNCSEKVDNPKYTLKNQKKSIKNKISKQCYKEFNELYNKDYFKFPSKILNRIISKRYKYISINKIVVLMKLFIDYYIAYPYKCRIYFDQQSCYMEIHTEKMYYIRYKFKNGLAIADYPISKDDINMQSHRNEYCEDLLLLFQKYPTLELRS